MAPEMFNPFEPGYFDDPYRQYASLRANDPVHESVLGVWILFRYDDVLPMLRNPQLSVEDTNAAPTARMTQMVEMLGDEREQRGSRAMLGLDPPDHTRLRRLVTRAFTPKVLERLRPRVQQLVDEALDKMAVEGEAELIRQLAFPLPFAVISDMLGMPESDSDMVRGWSHTMVKTLDPIISPEDAAAAMAASDQMNEYVTGVIAWKRKNPADDLLSALIAAEDGGDMLTEQELMDQVVLLYIAGHETTVNLIGNGTLALLRHPDQMRRLREDPSLLPGAIDELLRYDSPVQFSRRITLQEITVGDRTIPGGTFVLTCLGAANRDPAKWGDDADQLDVARAGAGQHVSFGNGAHFCLGANLARMEAQAAIGTLIRRFPEIELNEQDPPWNGRIVLRGLDRLPVALRGSA